MGFSQGNPLFRFRHLRFSSSGEHLAFSTLTTSSGIHSETFEGVVGGNPMYLSFSSFSECGDIRGYRCDGESGFTVFTESPGELARFPSCAVPGAPMGFETFFKRQSCKPDVFMTLFWSLDEIDGIH